MLNRGFHRCNQSFFCLSPVIQVRKPWDLSFVHFKVSKMLYKTLWRLLEPPRVSSKSAEIYVRVCYMHKQFKHKQNSLNCIWWLEGFSWCGPTYTPGWASVGGRKTKVNLMWTSNKSNLTFDAFLFLYILKINELIGNFCVQFLMLCALNETDS